MDKIKIKNILNGDIIKVHKATDHPDSSYGQAVWVDDAGNCYGSVKFGLSIGFEFIA
jgi:hypothetical protein